MFQSFLTMNRKETQEVNGMESFAEALLCFSHQHGPEVNELCPLPLKDHMA